MIHVQPGVHTNDPSSSFDAVDRIIANGRRASNKRDVLAALNEHPGLTAAELVAFWLPDDFGGREPNVEARRRLNDLMNDGLARQGASRICEVADTSATPWWPVEQKP